MKTLEMKAFVADADTQLPQVALQMHMTMFNQLVMGVCLHIQQTFNPLGERYALAAQYVRSEDFEAAAALMSKTTPSMFGGRGEEKKLFPAHVQGSSIYNWLWQFELLREYARVRNACQHQYLVGDEHYTTAIVYSAMHAMHQWRCACLKETIAASGVDFGADTGWHKNRFDEEVKDWPARYGFEASVWWPLPSEDQSFYVKQEVPAT
jgi:hypothetical protein